MRGRFELVGAYIDATDILEAITQCVAQFRAADVTEPRGLLSLQADAHAVMLDIESAVALEYRQRFYERNPEWSRTHSWPESGGWREKNMRHWRATRQPPTAQKPVKASRSRRARASSISSPARKV